MTSFRLFVVALFACSTVASTAQTEPPPSGGVFPSKEDVLSIPWEHPFVLPKEIQLPAHQDLSKWFPPAGDQYKQASCGGWAVGYGLATYNWNRLRDRPSPPRFLADPANVFSPSFVYNLAAETNKNTDCRIGIQLPDAIQLVCDTGCATWLQYPADTNTRHCFREVPDSAFLGAYRHRMAYPLSLDNFNSDQWKFHLMREEPVILFVSISDAYFMQGFLNPGKPFLWDEPMPQGTEWNNREGHIMVCTGYTGNTFRILNSWGLNWGDSGYVDVPDSVLTWACSDAYVVRTGFALQRLIPMGKAQERDLGKDQEMRGGLEHGEVHAADSVAFRVRNISADGHAELEMLDAGTREPVHVLDLREDQPLTFHHEGALYTFTWTGKGFFSGKFRYHLEKNAREQHAELKRQLEAIDRQADGVVDGRW